MREEGLRPMLKTEEVKRSLNLNLNPKLQAIEETQHADSMRLKFIRNSLPSSFSTTVSTNPSTSNIEAFPPQFSNFNPFR